MNKQRGIILELMLLAIVLASFAGLWAYYHTQMGMLTEDNVAKAKTITKMGQEQATCMEANTGLSTANSHFDTLVTKQNAALALIQRERNDKAAEALAEKKKAVTQGIGFKAREAAILAKAAGVDWCKTWGSMVTDYTVMRQAEVAK